MAKYQNERKKYEIIEMKKEKLSKENKPAKEKTKSMRNM